MYLNKDNYLLQLIKYVYNNPIKANLEGGIEYKLSSHYILYWEKEKQ